MYDVQHLSVQKTIYFYNIMMCFKKYMLLSKFEIQPILKIAFFILQ